MTDLFSAEVERALEVLQKGGTILYPTDTIWGIGCDALNEAAVRQVYRIKQRDDSKSLIILVASERDILQYVAAPDPSVFDFLAAQDRPTTVIFENALGLPEILTGEDQSIAIRIVRDDFCRHLVRRLRRPIVSTSANISGAPSPQIFSDISKDILQQVDHVVRWRQDDSNPASPSQLIRWKGNGAYDIIRK